MGPLDPDLLLRPSPAGSWPQMTPWPSSWSLKSFLGSRPVLENRSTSSCSLQDWEHEVYPLNSKSRSSALPHSDDGPGQQEAAGHLLHQPCEWRLLLHPDSGFASFPMLFLMLLIDPYFLSLYFIIY